MSKFEKDARDLLSAIGGAENISAVTHCATRLRFVLNDPKKAQESKIEQIPSVKGMFTNAGQFQVIIGNEVPTFYNDFTKISGVEGVSKEAAKSAAKQHQNIIQRLVGVLAEIFTPLLPAIIVGGLILGFRNILESVGMEFLGQKVIEGVKQLSPDGKPVWNTIVDISPFWAGINRFLWLPGEAIFHFLPVGVTWSITRKMGTTQILGIVLGITLVSPQLMNAYAVNGASAEDIAKYTIDFGVGSLFLRGYQAQVIPAMLAGFLLVYLERFFRRVVPEAISMIFVPLFALIPTIIAAHVVLGPVGWAVGQGISNVVNAGLTSTFSWLFGGIFGALYAPLVITGLHHTTLAIDSQLIADFGSTNLWPMIALSNIAQGAAVLGIIIAHKGNKKEEQISVPSLISAWLGVTEPAMFGINLKFAYPFVAAMIGSGIAGMFATFVKIRANAIGVGGLPGILAIRGQDMGMFLVAMIIAIVVPFVLTLFFKKAGILTKSELAQETTTGTFENMEENDTKEIQSGSKTTIFSPMKAEMRPLSECRDEVFSTGMMGVGVVMNNVSGEIFAPFDGVVTSLFPTLHAIGLMSDEGVEMLIHIGMDTVKLNGEHFISNVKQGDKVRRGEKLLTFDVEKIKAAGYNTQTPIVITNANDWQVDFTTLPKEVNVGEEIFFATKL
ncbi:PTS system, trehalose-specific IIC component [Pilibacter termitis]|uniref:PTS system sucrose-specific EIIBCA component n=1 Tax=Pilibacter termitis TaxID=263852 RepID=A0A1T4N3E2_9ENTE|nr:PTS system trehalose-specific EIIBC component [Pilibacter termitis]SJZ73829.1 PTS system, trehalose-specific IIC component [Pilibacter termitis]